MKKNLNFQIDMSLRTRGWSITFDERNLYLTAVHNKLNQIQYSGYEVLEDFESKTDDEIIEFIEDFQSQHKVKRGDAYLAIPRSEAVIQIAEFPSEAKDNLEEVMEYQLGNYFAGDLEEMEFFPQVVSSTDQLQVMIVAVKKERLGHVYSFIRRWKLKLTGVSLEPFSLVNGLAKTDTDAFSKSKIAVFRPSLAGLEMVVVDEGRLAVSHYFPIGKKADAGMPAEVLPEQEEGAEEKSEAQDETFEETSGYNEELETHGHDHMDDEGDYHEDAFQEEWIPVVDYDALVSNLEHGFSLARLDPNDIDVFIWAGEQHQEIKDFMTSEIGIPFDSWNDVTGKRIDDIALPGFGAAMCSVVDKPLLGLNMLPENLQKRQKRLPLILATVAIAIMAVFFVFTEARSYASLTKEAERVDREHAQIMDRMEEVSAARSQLVSRREQLELYKKYQVTNLLVKMLLTLSTNLPDNTFLTHIQVKNGDDITIQGESDDPFKIQRILTDIPYLKDVQPGNAITTGRNRDGKRRFMYKAVIDLEVMQ